MVLAMACVEVPDEHLDEGIAAPADYLGCREIGLTIHSSKRPPERAMVATKHEGWWFYIDSRDTGSKASFCYLQQLLMLVVQGQADAQAVPLLTVPVRS
jgi:hypothetical protein